MWRTRWPWPARDDAQRRTLVQVFLLNVGLAAGLLAAGLWADSSALLDNGSDAAVYAISYFAVARSRRWKAAAATASRALLIVLSLGVVADVIRRFIAGAEPLGPAMIAMALVATAVNALCLKLLARHREDVNLRAAWTFSVNDFLANFGIVVAGALVNQLRRNWPDLIVGLAIAAVATYGGVEIFRDAARSRHDGDGLDPGRLPTGEV